MKQYKNFDQCLNTIIGKAAGNAVTLADMMELVEYINKITDALDEADEDDAFGTEGWRHRILGEG